MEKDNNHSEKVTSDEEYRRSQTNNSEMDPSAKRNINADGTTQRNNQKDELNNLIIKGNEVTGYGGNNADDVDENNAGPGFGAEGSEYKGNPLRSSDDKLPG